MLIWQASRLEKHLEYVAPGRWLKLASQRQSIVYLYLVVALVTLVFSCFHSQIRVLAGLTWDRYYTQFQELGGICELFIEGRAQQLVNEPLLSTELNCAQLQKCTTQDAMCPPLFPVLTTSSSLDACCCTP